MIHYLKFLNLHLILSATLFFITTPNSFFCNRLFCSSSDSIHTPRDDLSRFTHYLNLLNQYPQVLGPIGNAKQGEIEIIRDVVKMQEIEQITGRTVGIIHRDRYWLLLNDPVQFPNGTCGVYGRLLWVRSLEGSPGVAVMPQLPDGKIVLNRNFRHATRSWEYELPRGITEKGESLEDAARREVKEETGMVIDKLYYLGEIHPDSGITNTSVPIFIAKVIEIKEASPEDSEAIAAIEAFTVDELKQGFIQGYLTIQSSDRILQVALKDPFLAFALFQAELKNYLLSKSQ